MVLGLISNAEAGAIHANLGAAILAGDAGAVQRILSALEDRAAAAADIGDEQAAWDLREAAALMAVPTLATPSLDARLVASETSRR